MQVVIRLLSNQWVNLLELAQAPVGHLIEEVDFVNYLTRGGHPIGNDTHSVNFHNTEDQQVIHVMRKLFHSEDRYTAITIQINKKTGQTHVSAPFLSNKSHKQLVLNVRTKGHSCVV